MTTGQRLVTGDTVNTRRAPRAGRPDAARCSSARRRTAWSAHAVEVEPVEPLELKGKAERVPAYRLISVQRRRSVERRHDTPLVGRDRELARRSPRSSRAAEKAACRLVTLIGAGRRRQVASDRGVR